MRSVWKWEAADLQHMDIGATIKVPSCFTFVKAGMQGSKLCVWAEIDTQCPGEREVVLEVFGTGHDQGSRSRTWIDTVIVDPGLVLHVYWRYP